MKANRPEISWRTRDWACESILEERRSWRIVDMDFSECWVEELKSERALSGGIFTIFGISEKA